MSKAAAASAVKNALQFLGPLQDLVKVLDDAAAAETYLVEVGPKIKSLKASEDEAKVFAVKVQQQLKDKLHEIEAEFQRKAGDLSKSHAAFEDKLVKQRLVLEDAFDRYNEGLNLQLKAKSDEISLLEADEQELSQQIAGLQSKLHNLKADLQKAISEASRG